MNQHMKIAYEEGFKNLLKDRTGGPFGAVISRNGKVIATARNEVKIKKDPTMHAEIVAIRRALVKIHIDEPKRVTLEDCEIYCSCYPCPMCLGAIIWAKIPKVYYGCKPTDAKKYCSKDIDDSSVYSLIASQIDIFMISTKNTYNIEFFEVDRRECLHLFQLWTEREK